MGFSDGKIEMSAEKNTIAEHIEIIEFAEEFIDSITEAVSGTPLQLILTFDLNLNLTVQIIYKSIFDENIEINAVKPKSLLWYKAVLTIPKIYAGPEANEKQIAISACSDVIAFSFTRSLSTFAPIGYPQIFPRRNARNIP
ncbi:MAG: hypothetical protein LIO49_04095 [Ruminococcus sp.]|nr:hypothetical protein [Ruminococcus sp.]